MAATPRYTIVLEDQREGDADGRAVEAITSLQQLGYKVEPPPALVTSPAGAR